MESDPDPADRRAVARAIVLAASIIAFAGLAAMAAWVLEFADATQPCDCYSMGSILYLAAGAVLVLVLMVSALVHLRRSR